MILELFASVVNVVSSQMNRQEALLAAISEKDANIALLELSSSKKKKTQEEVAQLKREKDRLVQQLKQQVGKRRFNIQPLEPQLFREGYHKCKHPDVP